MTSATSWKHRLQLIGLNLLIALLLGEGVLRLVGFQVMSDYHLVSTPTHHLAPDSQQGFRLLPGRFEITINDSLTYQATHHQTPWGVQRLNRRDAIPASSSPPLLLSGCSFLYGMGVNDQETYPFRLQQQLTDYQVLNAGVPAHGTLQSLIKLKQFVEQGIRPKAFLYHYLDSHQQRNLMGRSFSQLLRVETALTTGADTVSVIQFPQGTMKGRPPELSIQPAEVAFRPVLGSAREWSVLANQIEQLINHWSHSRKDGEAVTRACVLEMRRICEAEGIAFAVAIFSEDPRQPFMKQLCESEGLPYLDLTVDYTDPSYFNWPYDGHPNASTHQLYADRVWHFLQQNDWLPMIPE
ncbi:MAG: hypothetical protein AAF399_10470 [Bacteroidota bacterium]